MNKLLLSILFLFITEVRANPNQYCEQWGMQVYPIHSERFAFIQIQEDGERKINTGIFSNKMYMVISNEGENNGCYATIVDEYYEPVPYFDDLVIVPSAGIINALNFEMAEDANDLMEFVRSSGNPPIEPCDEQFNDSGEIPRPRVRPADLLEQNRLARIRPRERPDTLTSRADNLAPIIGLQGLDQETIPNEDCVKFVDIDGTLGEYGLMVQEYLADEPSSSSLFNNDMPGMAGAGGTCPNWSKFTRQQKTHYWAYALAAIADDESSCKANARNPKGSDGVAVGLLQMPEQRSGTKGYYWRGDNCRATPAGEMHLPRNNIYCSLDILKESMLGAEGEYRNTDGLVGGNIYWEKLRHDDGGDIGPGLNSYRACFD